MKWEARKIDKNRWGVFLLEEFCKTSEPVCYSASTGPNAKKLATTAAKRITSEHAKEIANDTKD